MSESIYLFKRAADSVWVFGPNVDCEHPSGQLRIIPNADRTKVSIIYFQKNEANQNKYDVPVGNLLKENGTAYADFAALKAGHAGFFVNASTLAGGGGEGFSKVQVINTTDGVADVDGVITGTTVFNLNADVVAVFQVFDGGIYRKDYVVSGVLGSKIITFTIAPLSGNDVDIFYN